MDAFSFDDKYVRRLLAGDPTVETHFFHYFRPRLIAKFRRGVHPASEADDLCQRVLTIAFSSLREGRGPDDHRKLAAWVFGIARNIQSEWYRATKPDQLDTDAHDFRSGDDQELSYITLERVEIVRRVIESLNPPARDRDLVVAVYLDERDRDDICREYGVDRQYLRVLVHRALKRFKELYPDDEMKRPDPARHYSAG